MKKSLFFLPLLLLCVFLLFSAVDKSDYAVEKQLWKIQQDLVLLAPARIVTPAQFESLMMRCENLLRRYPQSRLHPQIYIQMGQIYAIEKNFEKARAQYGVVLKKFPEEKELCAIALQGIGATFEEQKQSDEAINTYRQIIRDYAQTRTGVNMPLYLANYVARIKNEKQTEISGEAEAFYVSLAKEKVYSPEGLNALRYLATVYLVENNWLQAVKTSEEILLVYGQSPFMNAQMASAVIRSINGLSLEKLNDIDRPIAFYRMYIEKFPKNPISGMLKNVVLALEDFKKKKNEAAATK